MFFSSYSLILFLFSGLEHMIMLFLIMEILSWAFILVFNKSLVFYYLLAQAYFFLTTLLFFFMNSPSLALIALILKTGLPPFHMWFIYLLSTLSKSIFWFISSIHKILPILVMVSFVMGPYLFLLILGVIVVSVLMASKSISLLLVLAMSSMSHTGWIILSFLFGFTLVMVYMAIYYIIFYMFMVSFSGNSFDNLALNQSSLTSWSFLVMSGMPPFIFFWLKVNVLIGLILISLFFPGLMLIMVIFLILAYFRLFGLNLKEEQTRAFSFFLILFVSLIGFFF